MMRREVAADVDARSSVVFICFCCLVFCVVQHKKRGGGGDSRGLHAIETVFQDPARAVEVVQDQRADVGKELTQQL